MPSLKFPGSAGISPSEMPWKGKKKNLSIHNPISIAVLITLRFPHLCQLHIQEYAVGYDYVSPS